MNPKPTLMAELIAEFLGTFVLILFGTGVVAMVVLFPAKNPGETIHGGFTNITLGWGLAVTMGIYIAGKDFRSASESRRDLGARRFPRISLAQSAAVLHRPDRWRVCRRRPGLLELSAGVPPDRSATRPHRRSLHHVSRLFPAIPQAGFLDQFIGTGLLVLLIFAITDEFNVPPGANLAPADDRAGCGRHRHELRRHARLCHQSRARLRPAALHRGRGISQQRPHRRKLASGGFPSSLRCSGAWRARRSTTLAFGVSCAHRREC